MFILDTHWLREMARRPIYFPFYSSYFQYFGYFWIAVFVFYLGASFFCCMAIVLQNYHMVKAVADVYMLCFCYSSSIYLINPSFTRIYCELIYSSSFFIVNFDFAIV